MAVSSAPEVPAARSVVDLTLAANPNSPAPGSSELPGVTDGTFDLPGYRVIRIFGQGGMGEVFLADRLSSTGVHVRCVVKTIREGVGDRSQFENLFLDEARIISHLRHPNVVSILDVGRANGRLFLAMEWIDGLDAAELAKRAAKHGRDVPLPHVLYVLRETLKGLHYAHTAVGPDGAPLGIVHRDISPGNILISKHGAVKLADFGVAVAATARTAGSAETLAGKPHYFAPELWRRHRAGPSTDVFALGVTFFELLTARPLFTRGKDITSLAFEMCEFRVDSLLERELSLPDGLEVIVRRSLHEDPSERYATAMEFLEDVNDYAYEQGIRMLDAHFGEYVERMLGEPVEESRKRLWKG
ncbi:MAG: serine/threonine protein kinase [Myxococcales bacterium]|nr:serine/threonine protein kinase [Myxococcales bacterium]MCB9533257.1 serine/threonine protein kinase [Myxococcales bacterium]